MVEKNAGSIFLQEILEFETKLLPGLENFLLAVQTSHFLYKLHLTTF